MVLHTSFIGNLVGRGFTALTSLLRTPAVRGIATIGAGTAAGIGVANLLSGNGQDDGADFDREEGAGRRTRTIVQTLSADGTVVRQKVLRGSPHLMNRDLMIAKRVFNVSTKLHAKLPRKTVKESEVTALKNRIVKNALDKAGAPCPT